MSEFEKPRWLRDLIRFLPLKSQFVLSGNVHDLQIQQLDSGSLTAVPLYSSLAIELHRLGYQHVLAFDSVRGVRALTRSGSTASTDGIAQTLGLADIECMESSAARAHAMISAVAAAEGPSVAVLMEFSSRLTIRTEGLNPGEHTLFTRALVSSLSAKARPVGPDGQPFYNTIIWIVDRETDLPDWLLMTNPAIRQIPIARPDHRQRRAIVPNLLQLIPGAEKLNSAGFQAAIAEFVEQTEGLLLLDLHAIMQLSRSERLTVSQISDAVRRYKVGVTEDPWQRIDRQKVLGGTATVEARVKGQDHAVRHMLDIIKRAVTGVGSGRRGNRPRGVVFLAGPSGVGKTELAKAVTGLLFGDENACIRFDMSEFSAEHSDQRLIGAPPGYVGYDAGGELTNAIREKPFSVVLFDEIEKAHPRILDKFLQVLDDGVLTSGRGDRVYFSESFIIFTSNLGVFRVDHQGNRIPNITPTSGIDEVRMKVRVEIERYFKITLNRPEILNRIGENIVVFGYVSPQAGLQILVQMIDALLRDLQERGLHVRITDAVVTRLQQVCLADLTNGGRGIRNQLELHLINPLSRELFDRGASVGTSWTVTNLTVGDSSFLELQPGDTAV
jgi:hypothetical protein